MASSKSYAARSKAKEKAQRRANRPSAEERKQMRDEWRQSRLDAAKRKRDKKKQAKAEFQARQEANGGPSEEYLAEKAKLQERQRNNERIVADRGSERQVNFQKELDELKQSTGYGAGNTQDIRGHLREQLEAGYVPNKGGQYAGRSWVRQPGNKGDEATTNYLKGIAYGDTPTSYNDIFHRTTEGYVPMAEREGTKWTEYSPGGISSEKKDEYFRGEYDLRKKYYGTDKTFEQWNADRKAANRANAERHGNAKNRQYQEGYIDKYGNPTQQNY